MRHWFAILATVFSANLFAQQIASPINAFQTQLVQSYYAHSKSSVSSGFLPVLIDINRLDSISDVDTKNWQRREYKHWTMRKVKNDHFFQVRTNDFTLNGDLTLNYEVARQLDDRGRNQYTNSRGFHMSGTVGKRFFYQTSFYENQSIYPTYMDSVAYYRGNTNNANTVSNGSQAGSIPGFGRYKPFNTSDSSYNFDYTIATGVVGVRIADRSFIQFGNDRQFVGYGYRSILLSDASTSYPFLRFHLSFFKDKLVYTTNYAILQSQTRLPDQILGNEDLFQRQGARFSYLHFQPKHWFGVGLFDATTWNWKRNSHPESWLYYSPHAFVYGKNSTVNHLFGLNAFVNPTKFLMLYGQLATNFNNAKNSGAQIGVKLLEPIPGLFVTAEYNFTGGGLYESNGSSDTLASSFEPFDNRQTLSYYQHNLLPLAHPIGTEMREMLLRINYRWRDFFISGAYNNVAKHPRYIRWDSDFFQFEAGYIINPKSNFQVALGNINRIEHKITGTMHDTYTYIAFRTQLLNRYLDF